MDFTVEESKVYVIRSTVAADSAFSRSNVKTFRLGEIVHHENSLSPCLISVTSRDNKTDTRESSSKSDELWLIPRHLLLDLDKNLEQYINPVTPFRDRVQLVLDKDRCRRMMQIKVGDVVMVLSEKLRSAGLASLRSDKEAYVRYKGPISELDPGIYFGVELLMPEEGDVENTLIGHSGLGNYFSCSPCSGLILTANYLLPCYESSSIFSSNNTQSMERESSYKGPAFRVSSNVQQTRAKFESMSAHSQYGSHPLDITSQLDANRLKKTVPSTAPPVQSGTEDSCSSGKARTLQRTEMDKTVSSQPLRPDNLFSKEAKRRDVNSIPPEYPPRNGYPISPYEKYVKHLSSDIYKKDKKAEPALSDVCSYSNSNFSSNGKTTPVNKVNGSLSQRSSVFSDSVDGYKVKNTSRPVRINNALHDEIPVLPTGKLRDDFFMDKSPKVNNIGATNSLHSPGYSSSMHNSHSGKHFSSFVCKSPEFALIGDNLTD